MSPYERINAYRAPRRGPWRRWFSAALPWVFVAFVAAATGAVRAMLREGDVGTCSRGRDQYTWRLVAGVVTGPTGNVSPARAAAGHARTSSGGHRNGSCANAGQMLPK